MTDPSKERIAAALRLAEAVTEWSAPGFFPVCPPSDDEHVRIHNLVAEALVAYRATLPRPCKVYEWSRVPAELWANLAHECCAEPHWAEMRPELLVAIQAVQKAADVSRPTTDSGPSSVDTPDPPPVPVSPAGAAYSRETHQALEQLAEQVDFIQAHLVLDLKRVHVPDNPSGPPGVAAAKESTDNAAALEGAANCEAERCSCEEALGLQADVERFTGYMRDIKFLHRQWSDEKGLAGSILTQIGSVVLRWMSNLP